MLQIEWLDESIRVLLRVCWNKDVDLQPHPTYLPNCKPASSMAKRPWCPHIGCPADMSQKCCLNSLPQWSFQESSPKSRPLHYSGTRRMIGVGRVARTLRRSTRSCDLLDSLNATTNPNYHPPSSVITILSALTIRSCLDGATRFEGTRKYI